MFWFRRTSVPYIALAEGELDSSRETEGFIDDKQEKDELHHEDLVDEPSEQKESKYAAALTLFVVVLSIANVTFFIHQYAGQLRSKLPTTSDLTLELVSAYIGFDRLHALDSGATTFNYTIENMPLKVGTVDREHPNAVRPDETPHWWTFRGLVVPDRRHIFINETISTIVQFRAQDFGLETCQPMIQLPTYASLVNSTVKSDNNKTRTYSFSAPSVPVHVWALQSVTSDGRELEIDYPRLTFANRPQRTAYLGVIDAREGGRAAAGAFACKSASLHTLELSCETAGCALDFWTDQDVPRMAFFVEQSSS